MASHDHDGSYHPKDAIGGGLTGAVVIGSAGVLVSALKVALQSRGLGASGVFKQVGGTTGLFGMLSLPYSTIFCNFN